MLNGGRRLAGIAGLALLSVGAAPKPKPRPTKSAGAAPAPEPISYTRVEALIEAEVERLGIPGLSAAIVADGQLEWARAWGMADVENAVAAKPETVFRIASVSKPITALAAMQLVERGKLDLDAPVQKYVPGFPEKPWPITCRELLCHQSGIRHESDEEWGSTRHFTSVGDALVVFKDDPLLFPPGTRAEYSTYGFNLLGAAVEAAAGMRYLDYVRDNVFTPAGMADTRADDVFEIIPNRAAGYRRLPDGSLANALLADTSNKIPGGGLASTAADLARFAAAVEAGTLLGKDATKAMMTAQKTRDGRKTGYGLGWLLGSWRGRREVWHHGGQPRVSTLVYLQPEQHLAVVFLANLEGVAPALTDLARLLSTEIARQRRTG